MAASALTPPRAQGLARPTLHARSQSSLQHDTRAKDRAARLFVPSAPPSSSSSFESPHGQQREASDRRAQASQKALSGLKTLQLVNAQASGVCATSPSSSAARARHHHHRPDSGAPTIVHLSAGSSRDRSTFGNQIVALSGLHNLGNTCYFNAILQCLSASIPFSRFLRDGSYQRFIDQTETHSQRGALTQAAARLFSIMWRDDYASISPTSMYTTFLHRASQFAGDDQQDAQEALLAILQGFHDELRGNNSTISPVTEWFSIREKNVLKCQKCGHERATSESAWCISLSLPEKCDTCATLYDLLDNYYRDEILSGDDAWNCSRCKAPRTAKKALSIVHLPPMLIVHLSRVTQQGRLPSKSGLSVAYPVHNLDLSRYNTEDRRLRDLYAIVDHHGPAGFGHYTSTIRCARDEWTTVSDDISATQTLDEIRRGHRESSYLLFYALQN